MSEFTQISVSPTGAPSIEFRFHGDTVSAGLCGAVLYVEAERDDGARMTLKAADGELLADVTVHARAHRTLTENVMDVGSALLWSHWRWLEVESRRAAIMRALGEASMCWSETPGGVFDSEKAIAVGERLLDALTEIARPRVGS